MKAFFQRAAGGAARAWRATTGAVRRHPWLTAASLPLAVVVYVAALIPFTPSINDLRKARQEQPSVVLSADGQEIATFKRANRDWVKLQDISPNAVQALLATEDHRFREHHGIDVRRTLMAAVNTLRGDRQGGSTLTQQLARNLFPEEIGRAPTITRKVKEAITAIKLEAVYSKDEILETYFNSVPFLYNAWGIEAAARTYFDRSARDLDVLQAATLVGMLKGTAYYNPVQNPERALQRRNTVLAQLVRHRQLSAQQFQQLKGQPLQLDFSRLPETTGPAPHLAEYLRRWLIEWADRNDYDIRSDGLVVHTTIDSRLQAMATQALTRQADALQAVADVEWSRPALPAYGSNTAAYLARRQKDQAFSHFWNSRKDLALAFVRETPEYRALLAQGQDDAQALGRLQGDAAFMAQLRHRKTLLQAGFFALEPRSGQVKAWVGSRDYTEEKFDHVQQARRQPGSTFKPFVYGAAFEQGMSPSDTLMDAPVEIQIDRGQVWRPSDVGDAPSNLPMTLREGLARSKNTITAQVMMRVGPQRVASLARALGVRQSPLAEVPSLALGTSPVTLKEMVTAFASIANSGGYVEPLLVTHVSDRNGNTLAAFSASIPEQALSIQAAQTLLDVMRGVVEQGTAAGLKPRFGLSGDLAGKTGTTQDNTDGWFILMHPQLVAGAWVGFNDNRVTMRSDYWGQGAHNALLVVGDFMQQGLKARLIDAKATFDAPRLREPEVPLLQRMNDWFNSVIATPAEPPAVTVAQPAAASEPQVVRAEPPPWRNEPQIIRSEPQIIRVDPPIIRSEPPIARMEPPAMRVEPPITRTEPPVSRFEPPITRIEPPVSRFEPPITRSERPPLARIEPPIFRGEPQVAPLEPQVIRIEPPMRGEPRFAPAPEPAPPPARMPETVIQQRPPVIVIQGPQTD